MSDLNERLKHLRTSMRSATLAEEAGLVRDLVNSAALSPEQRGAISDRAATLVQTVRQAGKPGMMEQMLSEYGLSTDEGIALMCLAEAMLRVPDSFTVDRLIRDKITPHDWASHIGDSGSILVNASTWALLLTGRVLEDTGDGVVGTLHGLLRRMGEPVIRRAVGQAMAEMGSQFVLGRTIDEAMKRGDAMVARGYTYSYDMLGEAARTDADALRYQQAYADAIAAIARRADTGDVRSNPGISVKLSALHPRYERAQAETMLPVLSGRLMELAELASAAGIGFNIDAEEADRLDLSLDVIARVFGDRRFRGWDGFGVVVQAFGRRAIPALDWLYELAQNADRRMMVRLVKGAYWDMEIKRAQVLGLRDYPVFTRKCHTDVSFLAGVRRLFAMTDRIYPQFATHNAHTMAAVLEMAGDRSAFEFQRLHGMGEALHDAVREDAGTNCRIYAPVGAHQDLLAYLVRRLLENGANSSFVNQIVDLDVPASEIARDPVAQSQEADFRPHPAIVRPDALFAPRRNSRGWDLTDPVDLDEIEQGRAGFAAPFEWAAGLLSPAATGQDTPREVRNPALPDEVVGRCEEAGTEIAGAAVEIGGAAQPAWEALGPAHRAAILRKASDIFEANAHEVFALVAREAGKTLIDGVAELREAVDFLRYYSDEAERAHAPGQARGVIVCISPWNFPLAIFTGQIAAALAAGNAVIAKPAEQTPLIAHRAVTWLHEAGVPREVLQYLPGDGATVGAALTAFPGIAGVCFTGSTEVAKLIDRQLARSAPEAMFIAETGGLNAMIVDSTALPEQATRDIVRAAFQSAGQRCSALRVLYVQSDVRDKLVDMLGGAMDALAAGDPWALSTDVAPVIDPEAQQSIGAYIDTMRAKGRILKEVAVPHRGYFVPPCIVAVDGIADVEREIFGPVLHLASFDGERIDEVVADINARGYGLTFGLHSRIDARVQRLIDRIHVGNIYVNRDQIGAVVGSQPFGGHGLSGTGPKAGGPHYLPRFQTLGETANERAPKAKSVEGSAARKLLDTLDPTSWARSPDRVARLRAALRGQSPRAMAAAAALEFGPVDLPGPTGEANQFGLGPRGSVLCLGPDPDALRDQVVQALAAGNGVLAIAHGARGALAPLLGSDMPLGVIDGCLSPEAAGSIPVAAVAACLPGRELGELRMALAARPGPVTTLITGRIDPVAYCTEHTICIDTTAAGGNATLLAAADGG